MATNPIMHVILHRLGADARHGETVRVRRDTISADNLTANLAHRWAWRGVIDSDGPCVAVDWTDAG